MGDPEAKVASNLSRKSGRSAPEEAALIHALDVDGAEP